MLPSSTFLWYSLLCYKRWFELKFESSEEILKCDHSNKSYWVVLSCGTVYYTVHVQGGSNFWVCGWNPKVDHSNNSSWASLFCGSFYYVRCTSWFWLKFQSVATQMEAILRRTFLWCVLLGCRSGFIFWAWGQDSKLWPFQCNLLARVARSMVSANQR